MLRDIQSPESYFQTAFRVQTPWCAKSNDPNQSGLVIMKEHAYILDFSPNRAFEQMKEYAQNLDQSEHNPEQRLHNLMQFLPVLSYAGGKMQPMDVGSLMDSLIGGISTSQLARAWEAANQFDLSISIIDKIMDDDHLLSTIMKIEGFTSSNKKNDRPINEQLKELQAINEAVEKSKPSKLGEPETKTKEDDGRKKKRNTLRTEIHTKLSQFSRRIPLFMYISDYREHSLHDVIHQLDPDLFRLVTGLTQSDFQLLVEVGIFKQDKMDLNIIKFKRFEEASHDYTRIHRS
jgi:hypothetical protein